MRSVVISLTSYGERINSVHKVVDSLIKQTYQADKIILWLDETELTREGLPAQLSRLENEQFEVRFCPNYKSYKKLIPTLQTYPLATVITFDDDIIIPSTTVQHFIDASKANSDTIIATRGRLMSANDNGELGDYASWTFINNSSAVIANYCILPIGYGGVLYPPNSLNKEVCNIEKFTALAASVDDIWFKCMSLLNETPILLLPQSVTSKYKMIEGSQDTALYLTTNTEDKNGLCFKAIIDEYKNLGELLLSKKFNEISVSSLFLDQLLVKPTLFDSNKKAVEFFITSAIKLEKTHMHLAFKLMKLAKKYRPNGLLINRKLIKYKKKINKE